MGAVGSSCNKLYAKKREADESEPPSPELEVKFDEDHKPETNQTDSNGATYRLNNNVIARRGSRDASASAATGSDGRRPSAAGGSGCDVDSITDVDARRYATGSGGQPTRRHSTVDSANVGGGGSGEVVSTGDRFVEVGGSLRRRGDGPAGSSDDRSPAGRLRSLAGTRRDIVRGGRIESLGDEGVKVARSDEAVRGPRIESLSSEDGATRGGIRIESLGDVTGGAANRDVAASRGSGGGGAREQRRSSISFLPTPANIRDPQQPQLGLFSAALSPMDRVNIGLGNASDLVANLIGGGSGGSHGGGAKKEDQFWVPPAVWSKKRAQSLVPQKLSGEGDSIVDGKILL